MLEQAQLFFPIFAITTDQLEPLANTSKKDIESGHGAKEPGADVRESIKRFFGTLQFS